MGVLHSFEKNETATMFFLKKAFSSFILFLLALVETLTRNFLGQDQVSL